MILLRCPQSIYLAVQEAIQLTSKFQVQCETSFTYHEEEVIEIKMTGEPWAAVEDEFAPSRRLLAEIIRRIKELHWCFLGSANLKGASDALFFIQDEPEQDKTENLSTYPSLDTSSPSNNFTNIKITKRESQPNSPIAIVSLNGDDRMRLLDFRDPEIVPIISWTIQHFYDPSDFRPVIGDYFGSTEFVLPETPFHCEDDNALSIIRSRTMVCAILSALNSRGWEVFTTFISPTNPSQNLSAIMMSRCSPCVYPYSCISMTGENQVQFIAFRPSDCDILKMIAHQAYAPGIESEKEHLDNDENEESNQSKSVSFILKGQPWTKNSAYSCHGKSMLLLLLVKAEILGWRLIASLNVSNKIIKERQYCHSKEIPTDVDSWFFRFVGESHKPFSHRNDNNTSSHIQCNGSTPNQGSHSIYHPNYLVSEGHLPNTTLHSHSSNNMTIQYPSTSSNHKLHPEINYSHTFTSSEDRCPHHNGLSKMHNSCPSSFYTQEEKLMTTLV